ncbi:hypothetical protein Tco_0648683 [Tanacetum coccineum]
MIYKADLFARTSSSAGVRHLISSRPTSAAQGCMRWIWLTGSRSTMSCFFDDQLTSLSPKNWIPPEVLLRVSRKPAWSASKKAALMDFQELVLRMVFSPMIIGMVSLVESLTSVGGIIGSDVAHGDDITGIKRRRRDLSRDGVRNLATASGRGRLKRGSRNIYVATVSRLQSDAVAANANPSSSTSNSEFLDPKKKIEIESWLEDSRIVDSLVGLDEYFDTFPTLEELEYHEWLLKCPKPSWVKAKIRTRNLNNIKISCMIGHFLKRQAYIDLESPINVMSKQHYKRNLKKD